MSDPDEPVAILTHYSSSDSDGEGVHITIHADSDSDSDEDTPAQIEARRIQRLQQMHMAHVDNHTIGLDDDDSDDNVIMPTTRRKRSIDIEVVDGLRPSGTEPYDREMDLDVDNDWDDSMLDQVQNRGRGNVDEGDKKLNDLRLQQQARSATLASTPAVPAPTKKLRSSKMEDHRCSMLSPVTLDAEGNATPQPLHVNPSAPRFITHTICHMDLTNIKTLDDIDDTLNKLMADDSLYKNIVIVPPVIPDPTTTPAVAVPPPVKATPPPQLPEDTPKEVAAQEKPEEAAEPVAADDTTPAETSPEAAEVTPVLTGAAAAAAEANNKDFKSQQKKQEEQEKKDKEEKAKKEKEEKAKKEKEDKIKAEEAAKAEKKRLEEEKKKKEEDAKAEKKRKEEEAKAEKKRKEEEAKAEKKRLEEEKKANKNKKTLVEPAAPADGSAAPVSPHLPAAAEESSENPEDQPEISVHRDSVSMSTFDMTAIRSDAAKIDYESPDFPQPIAFDQVNILLQAQQPNKIASRFQKANVFGTSGYRKPEHRTCYFFQHLWQTDYDPKNRLHELMMNAFYMHMNEKVIIPNHNELAEEHRPAKSEIPEPTGQHWVDVVRSSNPDRPQDDLLGVVERYSILRPLEWDLKPSILTLYIALYILDGSPDPAYKALIVALLRKFFQRDNAPKEMSYLELFAPMAYIVNSLILSNTQVHSEPFYRMYYKYNIKKDFGPFLGKREPNFYNVMHLVIEYITLLPLIFWFRHLIQRYDYPTLVCAVRQRLLSDIKNEFKRVDDEYCKGGYSTYIHEVRKDNYLAQDLKVVFAEQKRQKHMLTPLEQNLHHAQQQRGPGRNSISYNPPASPTPSTEEPGTPRAAKMGPNIVIGKPHQQQNADKKAEETNNENTEGDNGAKDEPDNDQDNNDQDNNDQDDQDNAQDGQDNEQPASGADGEKQADDTVADDNTSEQPAQSTQHGSDDE